ncbi:MAG: glycosyltransferase [Polyangiaceae bacterium]
MGSDVVVVFSPVGGGHKSAAVAVAEAARARGLRTKVLDTFDFGPRVFGEAYLAAHLASTNATPELYGSAYERANSRGGLFDPIRRGFDHVALRALVDAVCDESPGVVVATHHLPLVVLGRARRTGALRAPLVGVVTDYTAHAVWAERGVDGFTVGCGLAKDELVAHGIDATTVEETGIPIRPAFERIPDVEDPREGAPLKVLVTSGGFGASTTRAIVRSFRGVDDVLLTIVTGDSPRLRRAVARDLGSLGVYARVLGFERDMPARIAESHLVVGKAGGLTVSETLAAGRPMIVVGAVPGNERRNEDRVTEGRAGFAAVPEDVAEVVATLRARRALSEFGRRARGLVKSGSADAVLDVALAHQARIRSRAASMRLIA